MEDSEFNINEAAEEIIAEGEPGDADSTERDLGEGQSNGNPDDSSNENELSPEEILNQLENEGVDQTALTALLEQVNGLGSVHSGQPIKVDSVDQLKELIQKGFDYTKKTMAHSDAVKLKDEEFNQREAKFTERETQIAQKEQELQSVVIENQLITNMLTRWKTEDPDAFEWISSQWQREMNTYNQQRPVIAEYEKKIGSLESRLNKFEEGNSQKQLSDIKQEWKRALQKCKVKKLRPYQSWV